MSDDTPDWPTDRGTGSGSSGGDHDSRRPEGRSAQSARARDPRFTDTRPPGSADDREAGMRPGRTRERMSTDYDDEPPRRRSATTAGGLSSVLGGDQGTRRLVYGAAGLGALLVAGVGGWSLLGGHHSGIPVIAPPPGPVRDRPADPGGMQIMSGEGADADTSGKGEAHLAPGPEQPRPDALAAQYGQPPAEVVPQKAPANPRIDGGSEADGAAGAPTPPPGGSDKETLRESGPAASDPPKSEATKPATSPTSMVGRDASGEDHASAKSVSPPKLATRPKVSDAPLPPPLPTPGKGEREVPTPDGAKAAQAGGHMVQLAALGSEADAHNEWEKLSHQASDLFAGRSPVVEHGTVNGRTFYRLRVGGFDTTQAARAFCVRLHARSIACTPAAF